MVHGLEIGLGVGEQAAIVNLAAREEDGEGQERGAGGEEGELAEGAPGEEGGFVISWFYLLLLSLGM